MAELKYSIANDGSFFNLDSENGVAKVQPRSDLFEVINSVDNTKITKPFVDGEIANPDYDPEQPTDPETNPETIVRSGLDGQTVIRQSVGGLQLADGSITSIKVADAAITNAKIGNVIMSDNYLAGERGWKIDKTGFAEFSTGAKIANWDIGENSIFTDQIAIDASVPSISLGAASDFLTNAGIWFGKDSSDGIYKAHIGNPGGDYLSWDGAELHIEGVVNATDGSIIGGTTTNTFTVNSDADAVTSSLRINSGGNVAAIAFDGSEVSTDKPSRFESNVTVSGNLHVLGTEFIANTETVEISDNLAIINKGETGDGITAGFAGWEADRGSFTNYRWGFDEGSDLWKIGEIGDLQAVATREDVLIASGVPYWDDTNNCFSTSDDMTFSSGLQITGEQGNHRLFTVEAGQADTAGALARIAHRGNSTPDGTEELISFENIGSYDGQHGSISLSAYNRGVRLSGVDHLEFNAGTSVIHTAPYDQSTSFVSGVRGEGWQIGDDGHSYLELDDVFIRNSLRTHIFQKDVVKAANGYLYISDSGVVSSVDSTNSRIGFDNSKSSSFENGVSILCKEVSGVDGTIKTIELVVDSQYSQTSDETVYSVTVSSGVLSDVGIGNTFVRTSGPNLLLDASSQYAPFMDVSDGSSSKVRIGNLNGISDDEFGSLDGYGIYTDNGYFRGKISVSSAFAFPSDENLVGYWSFDGGTAVDNSGNGNDGTIYGANVANGVSGECLSFDGTDDYVGISVGKLSGDLSIIYWIKPNRDSKFRVVNSSSHDATPIWHDDTKLTFVNIDGTRNNINYNPPSANTWWCVIVSRTNNNAVAYINGEKVGSVYWDGIINPINIGGKTDDTEWAEYDGLIDEVRIYNTALTENQIKALYLNPGGPKHSVITGSQVKTGKIIAQSGSSYFDLDNDLLSINSSAFGNQGIQLDYNQGAPRAYIGNGADEYFKFDGANISWSSPNTSLDTAGKLTTSSANVGGWLVSANKIASSNIELYKNGYIRNSLQVNSQDAWKLADDGSGHLAGGNITWDSTGSVTIQGDVSFADAPSYPNVPEPTNVTMTIS